MTTSTRRYVRLSLVALGLAGAAAWLLPSFWSAERFRRRLEAGLERTLRRSVTFGAVSLRLLPRPGFLIENAVVHEVPAFGPEPFARIDRIECDLRWRSLWRSHLDFARLRLERPSINIARSERGEWNIERLWLESAIASAATPDASAGDTGDLELEAEGGRLDFKIGADKKPFAVVDLEARLRINPSRGRVGYRLAGSPLRTDLSLPTPGRLELTGEWTPGADLQGPLNATLQSRGSLLYNWLPIATGHNPEIYGVLDAEVRLRGTLRELNLEGRTRITQLHRWELLPPSDPFPTTIYFRGQFDRWRGHVLIESLDASFAESRLHLTGSIDSIASAPELDLVVALERSRLEDFVTLGRRFWGTKRPLGLAGRVDGMLTIQGRWPELRYGGFLGARDVRLMIGSNTYPASEVEVRIDRRGARLALVRLNLGPRGELAMEGEVGRAARPDRSEPRYRLTVSSRSAPLRDLVRLGRALGVPIAEGLDAQGSASGVFVLAGAAWPLEPPAVSGRAELHAARLLVPGLTEPINLSRARIDVKGNRVVADPVVAVLGTTVLSGRLEHSGRRAQPWKFVLRAGRLTLEESALWFDTLGHRAPVPLLERLPGLSTLRARRQAASRLFAALNAQGRVEVETLRYRALTLREFHSAVQISGRVVRLEGAGFQAGGGRGQGQAVVDLTTAPAQISAEFNLAGTRLESLRAYFPVALEGASGSLSGTARLATRGLTGQEMSAGLKGEAKVALKNVSLGGYDPLDEAARRAGWGALEPKRGDVTLRRVAATLQAAGRRVLLAELPLEVDGARLTLAGSYSFDGMADVQVRADLRRIKRRRANAPGPEMPPAGSVAFELTGPLQNLTARPKAPAPRASR